MIKETHFSAHWVFVQC